MERNREFITRTKMLSLLTTTQHTRLRKNFILYGALVIKWIHTNMHTYAQTFFSLTRMEGEVWPGEILVCTSKGCLTKVLFFGFWGLTQIQKGCGLVDILKTFTCMCVCIYIYMDSWVNHSSVN